MEELKIMEDVVEEAIPATQIMEEAITPVAQEVIPNIEKAIEGDFTAIQAPKKSGLKTGVFLLGLAAITVVAIARKPLKARAERKEMKRQEKFERDFNRYYDKRRAEEIAKEQAAAEAEKAKASDGSEETEETED